MVGSADRRPGALIPLLCCVLSLGSVSGCSGSGGSPDLWLADFAKLQQEMAVGYANLEWAVRRSHIDVASLVNETETKLRRTTSQKKARKIIVEFLETFNDPHLRARHTDPPGDSPAAGGTWTGPAGTASSKAALEAFGYRKGKYDFGVDFEALDGFERLEDGNNPFPAGVLTLADGRRLGVIRIKYFGEDRYYRVAERTWEEFSGDVDGNCDQSCWWRFTLRVRAHLMEYLEARLDEFSASGVDAVVVDITGNGGGSEWCEDVAQLFTTERLVPPPAGFVKHAHWEEEIENELERIDKDLAREDLSPGIRGMLEEARVAHMELLEAVRAGCDPSMIWQGKSAGDCERLAYDQHGGFVVPGDDDGTASTLASADLLFRRPRHPGFVGLYGGPLFVVIDGGTASASEQFATLLQYNHSATIVGEKSYGAGCGYTRGGIKLYLENTELRVWMPDCVRVRADGENELAGVEPDVVGWEQGAGGKARARALVEALGAR